MTDIKKLLIKNNLYYWKLKKFSFIFLNIFTFDLGSVGNPLPGVEVRITEDSSFSNSVTFVEGNNTHIRVSPGCENKEGELLVRGPSVFKEYWNNEKATLEAFTHDGWFKTGNFSSLILLKIFLKLTKGCLAAKFSLKFSWKLLEIAQSIITIIKK